MEEKIEKIEKSPQAIAMLKKIKKENRKKFLKKHRILFGAIAIILVIFCFYYLIRNIFFYTIDSIVTDNMSKTIEVGDRVKVDKRFDSVEVGNVYKFEKDDEVYIARCIGTGGDIIRVENDDVYVNGMLFSEKYVSSKMESKINFQITVPKGEYFFLGDNRNHSFDSRYWKDRFVKKDDIIGQVTEIVYTFGKNKKITYY